MKLKDLKIGSQLKIGFGIILLLIVTLGVNSWQRTNMIAEQTSSMYNHPLAVNKALGDLKTDFLFMQRGMDEVDQAKDDKEIRSIIQEIDQYKADADKQLQVLYDRYLGPTADIDSVFYDFVKWNSIREETIRVLYQGNVAQAVAMTKSNGIGGLQVKQLFGHFKKIEDFARNKGDQFHNRVIEMNNSLTGQMSLILFGILTLSVLIIYLLNKNIHRPILELAEVTRLFGEGKTDTRSSYMSNNEFGQLSSSFNTLANTIQSELNLNAQSAKLSDVMLSEDEPRQFCHVLLRTLLEQTESQMGAVYLLNDEKTEFQHFESIGLEPGACQPFSASTFEGEFGAALSAQKLQHITNIQDDTRFVFSTVSGKFIPREIITIPIIAGSETLAIISLATINDFSKNSLRLLNSVHSTLCARMDGILAYRKIIHFSHQLEQQNTKLESLNKELSHKSDTLSVANVELLAQKRELSAQASELSEQNVELEMQKKQLDELNRLKSTFLSNMSHELRTPLNSVIALSGVLNRRLSGKVPDEEYSYLSVIERNGKQLLSLINDVLDLSRIESGHDEIDITNFKANDLIWEVVETIKPQADQKGIRLSYLPGDGHLTIGSDYEKVRHILQNLLANAVKFTDEGEVEISSEVKDDALFISVKDTGIGISKENLPNIFDEFRQGDGSNSRKYGGTGLGLAIAKKYADMLSGNITVESKLGKGSLFVFSLPLHNLSQTTGAGSPDQIASYSATNKSLQITNQINAKDKTILLVEDTDAMIIQMKDMLESQGYNIMVAHNGREAIEQIEIQVPDAMILDLMMPGVDGFEVLRCVREEEKTNRLPVIILTAKYVTKKELAFLKNNGIRQVIQKGDINKDQLLSAVSLMMLPESNRSRSQVKKKARKPIQGTPVVLVVEDNPDNMLSIKALLGDKNVIIEAENGLTGIELALKHHPHLILMDIALPGMNGIEALNELRKIESMQHIPVVAVSASAMKGDREDFITFGFDGYISKPIDGILFEQTIKEFLN